MQPGLFYNYFDVYISSTKGMELGVLGVVGKLGTRPNSSSDDSFSIVYRPVQNGRTEEVK